MNSLYFYPYWIPRGNSLELIKAGMDLLGGGAGGCTPLALARGGAIFHDKANNYYRDKMRYSNLSNNMMISKL